jgi:hypothetical protein
MVDYDASRLTQPTPDFRGLSQWMGEIATQHKVIPNMSRLVLRGAVGGTIADCEDVAGNSTAAMRAIAAVHAEKA